MYIFNVTFHIDDAIIKEALVFLKKEYIPKATQNGMLFNPRMCFILPNHKDDGKSYSIQFYVKNKMILNDWYDVAGNNLHQDIITRFGGKLVGFTTILEELDLED